MSQLVMMLPTRPAVERARVQGFRAATAQDEPALAELLTAAFPGDQWDAARVRSDLTGASDVARVFVFEEEGRIAATASARHDTEMFPDRGCVHWVGVLPQMRGRSLGESATQRVVEYFAEQGPWPVVLTTDDERLPALSTYLGLGFIPHYTADDHPARWSRVFMELKRMSRSGRAER